MLRSKSDEFNFLKVENCFFNIKLLVLVFLTLVSKAVESNVTGSLINIHLCCEIQIELNR